MKSSKTFNFQYLLNDNTQIKINESKKKAILSVINEIIDDKNGDFMHNNFPNI